MTCLGWRLFRPGRLSKQSVKHARGIPLNPHPIKRLSPAQLDTLIPPVDDRGGPRVWMVRGSGDGRGLLPGFPARPGRFSVVRPGAGVLARALGRAGGMRGIGAGGIGSRETGAGWLPGTGPG
jgi:hypothetical protein